MRWIEEKADFDRVFLEARTCKYIDSGRDLTTLQKLSFDDAEICTMRFAAFLQRLLEWFGDSKAYYIVLDHDPIHYFYCRFKKYPLIEIAYGDSSEAYIALMNEDPGGSPVDAVGTNWWESVILPPSNNWFVHALRSSEDNGGHLWVPEESVAKIIEAFPFLRREATAQRAEG